MTTPGYKLPPAAAAAAERPPWLGGSAFRPRPWFVPLVVCGLLSTGCGSEQLPTIPVSGKVTFDGGPPPAAGSVQFLPLQPAQGMPRRPGTGSFDLSGEFVAASFNDRDGLVPGTYRVVVQCWRQPPGSEGEPGVSYIADGHTLPDLTLRADDGVPPELQYDVPLGAEK